jgi:hypothetical protein
LLSSSAYASRSASIVVPVQGHAAAGTQALSICVYDIERASPEREIASSLRSTGNRTLIRVARPRPPGEMLRWTKAGYLARRPSGFLAPRRRPDGAMPLAGTGSAWICSGRHAGVCALSADISIQRRQPCHALKVKLSTTPGARGQIAYRSIRRAGHANRVWRSWRGAA